MASPGICIRRDEPAPAGARYPRLRGARRSRLSSVSSLALSVSVALGLGALCACGPAAPPAAPEARAAEEPEAGDESWAAGSGAGAAPAAEGDEASAGEASGEVGSEALSAGDDDGLDADIAALSASTQTGATAASPAPGQAAPPDPAGREIVYRVTPKGLVIEIDGFHLRPEAKPFKDRSGAYGIRLSVAAESFDGRKYWVNKPKEGPLSIAGKVEAQGKSSRFSDERQGSGEELVLEGSPRRFEQRWPGRGQPKLRAGETVTLEVGLWGVRVDDERERPVRRLFVVKMVAGPRSQAVITPPTMDWGT